MFNTWDGNWWRLEIGRASIPGCLFLFDDDIMSGYVVIQLR